jgi:thiosulfate reductase cytochrome b subunit
MLLVTLDINTSWKLKLVMVSRRGVCPYQVQVPDCVCLQSLDTVTASHVHIARQTGRVAQGHIEYHWSEAECLKQDFPRNFVVILWSFVSRCIMCHSRVTAPLLTLLIGYSLLIICCIHLSSRFCAVCERKHRGWNYWMCMVTVYTVDAI